MNVSIAENISKLLMEHKPPVNIVTLGIDYDQSLKASFEFDYSGMRVPYSKAVMINHLTYLLKAKKKTLFTGLSAIINI